MDKDDAAGAEEDVVDDEGDDTEIGNGVTVDKVEVVNAVEGFELAEVGVTDKTVTFVKDGNDFVDVENCFADAEDDFTDVKMDEVQSPKPAWQPFPQYAEDEPQYPLTEQQFPNAEPLQVSVFLDCVPQRRTGRVATANNRPECIVNEDGRNE